MQKKVLLLPLSRVAIEVAHGKRGDRFGRLNPGEDSTGALRSCAVGGSRLLSVAAGQGRFMHSTQLWHGRDRYGGWASSRGAAVSKVVGRVGDGVARGEECPRRARTEPVM